jgi:hypothetical protein
MKRINLIVNGILVLGIIGSGAAVSAMSDSSPARPDWVTADNTLDLHKLPDNAKIPYHCWSGKMIALEGKTFKQHVAQPPSPGTKEHNLALAKSIELRKTPGVATRNEQGGEQFVIDESNPEIQKIMKKYEAKETPECQ